MTQNNKGNYVNSEVPSVTETPQNPNFFADHNSSQSLFRVHKHADAAAAKEVKKDPKRGDNGDRKNSERCLSTRVCQGLRFPSQALWQGKSADS